MFLLVPLLCLARAAPQGECWEQGDLPWVHVGTAQCRFIHTLPGSICFLWGSWCWLAEEPDHTALESFSKHGWGARARQWGDVDSGPRLG